VTSRRTALAAQTLQLYSWNRAYHDIGQFCILTPYDPLTPYGKQQSVARGTKLNLTRFALASQTVQCADRGVIGKEADERRGLLSMRTAPSGGRRRSGPGLSEPAQGINAPLLKELRELREF
jgi:hypothetical protein